MNTNIELDQDAFERLQQARQAGESWSEVIKRCVRPRRSLDEVISVLRAADVSPETLDAIEESAARRHRVPHRRRT